VLAVAASGAFLDAAGQGVNVACDIGLIGLAVMGQNLVLNIESRGFRVAVFNRTASVTEDFVLRHPGRALRACPSLVDFVASLDRPRKILVMVQAGAAVDAVIEQLLPLLARDDIVVDCGNSLYTDTERRDAWLSGHGLRFVGAGVSGGEEGARKGPSIMPGGPASTWEDLRPVFEAIAARVGGEPCVTHIGPGGAGHFVKMVHNGIEYGDMQLICEAWALMRAAGLTVAQTAEVFSRWNEGPLQSYLIEITARALEQVDPDTGQPLVDVILDKAGQKGTGRWTLINAAELAVPVGTMGAAVDARILSSMRTQRLRAATLLQGPAGRVRVDDVGVFVAAIHDALYASKVVSYAQGLDLMRTMSVKKGWSLDLGAIAAIWRGGCIIRARFLEHITEAWRTDPGLTHLAFAPFFRDLLNRAETPWRRVVAEAVMGGVPVPAFSASLAYFDSLRSARLPANLLQAQRDFFGAHTYERVDRPEGQFFHTVWPEIVES
jgi:6-phosphogluconate dehydrogenase